jgi:hypothetical protein
MQHQTESTVAAILFVCFALLLPGLFWFHRYTGLARSKAHLALIGSVLACGLSLAYPFFGPDLPWQVNHGDIFHTQVPAGASYVFLTAFALRLWGRWIGEKATPEERQPGQPGVRAWFCASNVIVGVFIAVTIWLGFDIPLLLSSVVIGALLAAYPLLQMESPAPGNRPAVPHVTEDHSAEREKILAMLEAGKLTPEESAELLQALREPSPPAAHQVPLTGGQRLMLIGAALVAVGFFLPWLVVNPGKEAGRMMNQMQSSMRSTFQGDMSISGGMDFPGMQLTTANVSISGGDIPRGLGWATLLLALAAAALPYVATRLDAATTRTVRLLCLGLGSFILLYVLTQNVRFVSIGLILAIGGYAVGITGWLRDRRAPLV